MLVFFYYISNFTYNRICVLPVAVRIMRLEKIFHIQTTNNVIEYLMSTSYKMSRYVVVIFVIIFCKDNQNGNVYSNFV